MQLFIHQQIGFGEFYVYVFYFLFSYRKLFMVFIVLFLYDDFESAMPLA